MNNSKLIILLQTLDEVEKKEIKSLLRVKYFNQSKDVLRLWEIIWKQLAKQNERLLRKKVIFAKLFASTPYSDIKLRNLMRKLTKIIEDHLLIQHLQKDNSKRISTLNKIYNERNLYELFTKNTAKLKRELANQTQRGSDYFLLQFELINQYYLHPNTEKNDQSVLQLRASIKYLNAFYHTEKLRTELELVNQERIFSRKYDDSFFAHSNVNFACTLLLQKLIELVRDPNEAAYFSIKKTFFNRHIELSKEDAIDIFQGMLNYALRRELQVGVKFTKEIFELYKFGLVKEIILIQGKITGGAYYNSTLMAIKLARFQWTEDFITKYKDRIASIYADDFVAISLGHLHFGKKEFDKVVGVLNSYSFQNEIINLQAKQLLCKTFYELVVLQKADISLCQNTLLSFEKYLKRKAQIADTKKQPIFNFIFLTYKMISTELSPNANQKEWKRLQQSFNDTDTISNKKWLKEKLAANINN